MDGFIPGSPAASWVHLHAITRPWARAAYFQGPAPAARRGAGEFLLIATAIVFDRAAVIEHN
jgi:hypothetical protein